MSLFLLVSRCRPVSVNGWMHNYNVKLQSKTRIGLYKYCLCRLYMLLNDLYFLCLHRIKVIPGSTKILNIALNFFKLSQFWTCKTKSNLQTLIFGTQLQFKMIKKKVSIMYCTKYRKHPIYIIWFLKNDQKWLIIELRSELLI